MRIIISASTCLSSSKLSLARLLWYACLACPTILRLAHLYRPPLSYSQMSGVMMLPFSLSVSLVSAPVGILISKYGRIRIPIRSQSICPACSLVRLSTLC